MKTYHIHINGIVQGVGFRPFVYLVAKQLAIKGKVRNDADGVNIWFNADKNIADNFFLILTTQYPPKAKILSSKMKEIEEMGFDFFFIDTTQPYVDSQIINTLVSPDLIMCETCKKELYDKNNRRYRYPFITCTACGPRYSIVEKLPYERYHTTMDNFKMCDSCEKEYLAIEHRRYFSQTNSCERCGIKMSFWENQEKPLLWDSPSILAYCKQCFLLGKIIAVKGVGGYLLMCDANDSEAIKKLRQRKHRPKKPFAVLYPNIAKVIEDFEVSLAEQNLLQSVAGPIVLLKPKSDITQKLSMPDIAPQLNTIGVMLASNALLDLLVCDFGKPLIATSANISGSPIIYNEEEALKYLFHFADYILMHNRAIVMPQDDSVLRYVSNDEYSPILMRRSRGYAPIYYNEIGLLKNGILSLGAMMKSTFALSVNKHIFVSQYLGGGGNYEYQETYKKSLLHFLELYKANPQKIVADMHPDYFTHQLAQKMSFDRGLECVQVQHHKAHFAAVLAENKCIDSAEKILGIIWDGTGLGIDGNIWGSEFFLFHNNEMNRVAHFEYFSHIGADQMALQPRLSLLSIWDNENNMPQYIAQKFSSQEIFIYQKLIREKTIKNASAGRFIDAVSSLLDLCDSNTYEGEAAMYLQIEAEKYFAQHGYAMNEIYGEVSHSNSIDIKMILHQVIKDKNKGVEKSFIAAKFFYSLVCIIREVAEKQGVEKLCFSGGVFQNTLLVFLLKYYLGKTFQLYFHHQLSANDENISLGQLFYVDRNIDHFLAV